MGDVKSLYSQAMKLIVDLRGNLEKLEAHEQVAYPPPASASLMEKSKAKMRELDRISSAMESMWRMQSLNKPARPGDAWKTRVEQVSESASSIRMALEEVMGREGRRRVEQSEREQLLQRVRIGDAADSVRRGFDAEAQAMKSISNSKRILADSLEQGAAILQRMGATRERLKSAHRKVLDVANVLGVSESLLRVIEGRQRIDQRIAYGGMVATLLLIALLLYWKLR
ncbi:unnamed protein product [Pedinophyceae sp. YPF-701]|nr:unnamed protein product [Pedinophyceae sp. YPF-701]